VLVLISVLGLILVLVLDLNIPLHPAVPPELTHFSTAQCSSVTDTTIPTSANLSSPEIPLMSGPMQLNRKYEYRRKLPHYQKAGRILFITFRKE
jgi:hypothetical protein